MAKIRWSRDLIINVQLLDEQHEKILYHFNNVVDAVEAKKNDGVVKKALDRCTSYILIHLKEEEELMLKYDYSGYINHKNSYEILINLFSKVEEIRTKGKEFFPLFHAAIKNLIEDDINIVDRKFGEYLNKKGIAL